MWPYLLEIVNAIGDRGVERVTVMKSARVGYTKALMFSMAAMAVTDPGPTIILMPTDEDARGVAVDEVEPLFKSSPILRGIIRPNRADGRTTLLRKALRSGGSIKILSARAPRKLRRHDCRLLLADEVDAYEPTAEGDALALGERRTMAQAARKIVVGSTPRMEDTSAVYARYLESSQEIFEVPCPHCGAFSEIKWSNIEWEPQTPETAAWMCPNCKTLVTENYKPSMVIAGRWRAERPEIRDHRGFHINALVSLLPNASWKTLAKEYLEAKRGGLLMMQVFHNTVLARPWRTTVTRVDAMLLADRAEPWGLSTLGRTAIIPPTVQLICAGVDTQDDRLEAAVLGFPIHGAPFILGHVVFPGNTLEDGVWREFDAWTKTGWNHPNGWRIGLDGVAINSGGREGRTQKVYDYCFSRMHRRIFAIKGLPGPRKIWTKLQSVKGDMRAFGVAVDVLKTEVLDRLGREPFKDDGTEDAQSFRLSDQLSDEFFTQITNETLQRRFVKNRPVLEFQPKKPGIPTEALDCVVYALAVRQSPSVRIIDLRERAARRPSGQPQIERRPSSAGDWAAKFSEL